MPQPLAVRLVTRAERHPRGALPFGLRAWSPDAVAIAVLLQVGGGEVDDGEVLTQVPPARAVAPATTVFVLGGAARSVSPAWPSWLPARTVRVGRAPRCAALLMRGYVELGAGIDQATGADLVWGFSSPC